jgi:hypothetical protein
MATGWDAIVFTALVVPKDCSELGAIQHYASATLVAFANHFTPALHALYAANRTENFIPFLLVLATNGRLNRMI